MVRKAQKCPNQMIYESICIHSNTAQIRYSFHCFWDSTSVLLVLCDIFFIIPNIRLKIILNVKQKLFAKLLAPTACCCKFTTKLSRRAIGNPKQERNTLPTTTYHPNTLQPPPTADLRRYKQILINGERRLLQMKTELRSELTQKQYTETLKGF